MEIDWLATLGATGSGGTVLAFIRWMVGLYQDHAKKQREHEAAMTERYEALMTKTLDTFREMEKDCHASFAELAEKVGDLGNAIQGLRSEFVANNNANNGSRSSVNSMPRAGG